MNLMLNIDVDDVERAAQFYAAAFGLVRGRRLGPDILELTGASAPIYLMRKASGTAASATTDAVRDYRRHWTPVHIDVVVDDIEAALTRATNAGAALEAPVQSRTWGRLALMADPFGHGFCLVQFTGRGYDELVS